MFKNNAKATLKVTTDATEEGNPDDVIGILAKAVKAQFATVNAIKVDITAKYLSQLLINMILMHSLNIYTNSHPLFNQTR